MSKQTLTLFGLSLVILLGFGITYKNLAPVTDDGYRSARERAMLKRYDANGDGELDAQEREQLKKRSRQSRKSGWSAMTWMAMGKSVPRRKRLQK